MSSAILPPSAVRRLGVPTLRPTAVHQWQASRLSLTALTGQAATLTRSGTGTFTDSGGTTVTAVHSMPRWESRIWFGAPAIGLRLGTDDLSWPLDWPLGTLTLLIEGINLGTAQTSGHGLLYAGLDAGTGNRLVVRGTGTTIAVDLVVGANTSTATFGSAVANPDPVQLVVQVEDTGTTQRVRIGGTDAGTPVAFSAWGTAIARGTLPSGSRLRLNRVGSAGAQGNAWVRRCAVYAGLLTLDESVDRL